MNIIEINNLTKYYGKTVGIEKIGLDVRQGEIFGFIGPNGAGKSTTIRTLLNLIFPSSGSAQIFGLDIVKDTKAIKQKTGYLPAEANYYHKMTVEELFAYSARFFKIKDHKKRMDYLCDALALDTKRKISDLSSGNKKKVSIVQSLLHSPELLILDEPTSGLDPLVQSEFYDILREDNKKGMTVFFSSHVLSEVQRICHRVAIIRKGKIVKVESIDKLKKNLLKHVTLTFKENNFAGDIKLKGIVNPKIETGQLKFLFEGNINDLINYLSGFQLDNISIEEPSLDEVFLHFYKNKGDYHVN